MRFAILLSLAAWTLFAALARADDAALIHVKIGANDAYILPEAVAVTLQADIIESIPGKPKIDGFWTPPLQDVTVADRAFRDAIRAGAKDPSALFPDLAPNPDPTAPRDETREKDYQQERAELQLVAENYPAYARQYVGVIIDGQKLVLCNYSDGTKVDPAQDYIFIQRTFATDGTRFIQCRFEPLLKNVTNVSLFGSWQSSGK